MSIWEAIFLGIVQGIAEFLPISSSGHLCLLEAILGRSSENLELNIALHFGSLISILWVYRGQVIPVLKQPRLVGAIVIATLPVVFTGFTFKKQFELASASPLITGFGLLYTSLLLFVTPRIDRGQRLLEEIRYRDALVVGLMQAIAPLPGISRSGSTIVGGLLTGMKREAAANFSFYIAVPVLMGATVLQIKDVVEEGGLTNPIVPVLIGTVVSAIVGIFALQSLLRIIAARKLYWFAWYVLIVAVITFIASGLGLFPSPVSATEALTANSFHSGDGTVLWN